MASTNKLYPPIINNVIPAFYKLPQNDLTDRDWTITLTIPFSVNNMVSNNSVKTMRLRLKTIQTNEVKYYGDAYSVNLQEGYAIFHIGNNGQDSDPAAELQEGLFYKAQIAYIDTNDIEGYFSTVGIIKCIAKPSVSIANFSEQQINSYNNRFLGIYEQDTTLGDSNEKVYSYNFTITDKNNSIYITSGEQLHNVNTDINSWSSQDEFIVHKLLVDGEIYYLKYTVTTVNGLIISSPTYRIMSSTSVDMEKIINLYPELNYDEGYIQINFQGPRRYRLNPETNTLAVFNEDCCSGLFLLSRGYLKDDYMVWEDIARFYLNNELPSKHIERDFTIEQGITYKYRLQQYNLQGVYSNPVYSEEIYADFEDMFLYDGVRQLKVRFNPKVASFKVDIPEQKLETIGSKYPFIFRNGNVYYHEFPISGLISYQLDEAKLFLTGEEQLDGQVFENNMQYEYATAVQQGWQQVSHQMRPLTQGEWEALSPEEQAKHPLPTQVTKQYTVRSVKQTLNNNKLSPIRIDKDLTSENLMSERYFKLAVLDWLTNGEIKLFRSPGEGNYLVRLLNTSMTPNDTLGRMLHTFNTTAYEIADLTYDNLLKYNLIAVAAPELGLLQTSTIIINQAQQRIYAATGDDVLYTFEVNDCMPGDQILITYTDNTTEVITIGVTGSYSCTVNDKPIQSIDFTLGDGNIQYPRSAVLTYMGIAQHYFDFINNVNTTTNVGRMYYGPEANLVDMVVGDVNTPFKFNIKLGKITPAYKTKLLNMEMLRVRRREIIPLFKQEENKYSTTPFGVGYPLNELVAMDDTDKEIINRFAIFAIYVQENDGAVPHSLTPLELQTQDKQYNEMYPDWVFLEYIDLVNDTSYTTKPEFRFAINTEIDSDNLSYVYLDSKEAMTLYNLGPITLLTLGNGVMAETVMRLQVIDYTLESSDIDVAGAKNTYLQLKDSILTEYNNYVNTRQQQADEYNEYIVALKKKTKAIEEYDKLNLSYQVLQNYLTDPIEFKSEMISTINQAIRIINGSIPANAISGYKHDYYNYINQNSIIKPQGTIAVNSLVLPNDLDENLYDDTINDVAMDNLTPTTNEIINDLQLTINNIAAQFNNFLSSYNVHIPTIDETVCPEGWDERWGDPEFKETAAQELMDTILAKLQEMYILLRYNNIDINPFTDTYYRDNNIIGDATKYGQWNEAEANIVLNTQNSVGGIEPIDYNMIEESLSQEDGDVQLYNLSSQIIEDYLSYQEGLASLEPANRNVEEKQMIQAEAQEAYDLIYQVIIDINNHIQTENNNISEQNNTINTAQILIDRLETEEDTEGNRAAIKFLQSSIRAAQASIRASNNAILQYEQQKDTYLASDVYIDAYNALIQANTDYNNAVQEYNNIQDNVNALQSTLLTDIANWNNNLTIIQAYIRILLQLNDLLNTDDLDDLQDIINQYNYTYNNLVSLHEEYYLRAINAINEISSLALAFNKLYSLQMEWEAQLAILDADRNMIIEEKSEPTLFNWDDKIAQLKAAWQNFILELRAAYQIIEERYFV